MTERQESILDFIRQYQLREQVPPSSRIIQSQFNLKAQSTVTQHLAALAKKGLIEQFSDGRWGVKASGVQTHLFELPVIGDIPAGLPSLQEQESEESISIDPAAFGIRNPRAQRLFALKVRGDSMIDAHILPGDLVLCEWREPKLGEVIAALVDDTTVTLKKLVKERGRLLLRAANPAYADIKPDRIEAQGVVVGVIRQKVA
jgi:repressor LexA